MQIFSSYALGLILDMMPYAAGKYSSDMAPLLENETTIILAVTIAAPLIEELIFRFLIMGLSRRFIPFAAANLIQAAIFGIYHMNLIQGIYAFLLGLLLGLIMNETKTIFACIGFHLAFNAAGLLADDFAPRNVPVIVQLVIMTASLAAGVLIYLRAVRRR